MDVSQEKGINDIEDLRSAIQDYKNTIKKVECQKIQHYNKLYMQKMQQNLNSREDSKLSHTKHLIPPSLTTLQITTTYLLLQKICTVYQISMIIPPTLFLPNPCSFIYTDFSGHLKLSDSEDCFSKFFDKIQDSSSPPFPACIFKRSDNKLILFSSAYDAKNYLLSNPLLSGIMQKFIAPASEKISVCKVHWKDKKFKYYLISNKKQVQRDRAQSAMSYGKRKSSLGNVVIEAKDKKRRDTVGMGKKEAPCGGIIGRIQSRVKQPWKVSGRVKLHLPKGENLKFLVSGVSSNDAFLNNVSTSYPDVERTIQSLNNYIKRHLLNDKIEVCEMVCKFIKDSKKNWVFLDCTQIKIVSADYKEVQFTEPEVAYAIKVDSGTEINDEVTQIYEDDQAELELPKPFDRGETLKTQLSLKNELNQSFNDRFRHTISKIDRIKSRERINPNIGLRYELNQYYKNALNIDKNDNIPSLMIARSPEKPFVHYVKKAPSKQKAFSSSLDHFNTLHSSSTLYNNKLSLKSTINHTSASVEAFDKIVKSLKKVKFVTRKLDIKYGGDKFLLVFNRELVNRMKASSIGKFVKVFHEDGEEMICPGLKKLFDCVVNLSFAKLLHDKHAKLSICKEEFDLFADVVLTTIKDEFYFSIEDLEYLVKLMNELSRDICIKKRRSSLK